MSLKQSARVFKDRFLGSPHLLQGPLVAYPMAAGAAMLAVEATTSPEVSQMAAGQVYASTFASWYPVTICTNISRSQLLS